MERMSRLNKIAILALVLIGSILSLPFVVLWVLDQGSELSPKEAQEHAYYCMDSKLSDSPHYSEPWEVLKSWRHDDSVFIKIKVAPEFAKRAGKNAPVETREVYGDKKPGWWPKPDAPGLRKVKVFEGYQYGAFGWEFLIDETNGLIYIYSWHT